MQEGIHQLSIEDANYPESLKGILDAPKVLYYRGSLPLDNEPLIAIVGTRRPSPYGHQVALHLTEELIEAGITIVSGMAPGIDTFAHTACVQKKKKTIAVLGTGLDEESIYPRENIELSRQIIAHGGCLISELPPGTHGSKFSFPKRNRIISGLSLGVVIVEAKEKSGSLITAQYAKRQKKKLFAVPGPIFSGNAKGPNNLIKGGAILVQGAQDILKELHIEAKGIQKELIYENTEEKLILMALQEESLYIDKIIEKTKLQASLVAQSLALMEISGKIRNLGGNIYSIT